MRKRLNTRSGLVRALIVTAAIALTSAATPLGAGAATDTSARPGGTVDVALLRGPVPFGTYRIQNRGSGRCLDHFTDGPGTQGNSVGMFTCNTSSSEKWQLISSGDLAYPYLFRNARSGLCLTAPGVETIGYYFMDSCSGSLVQTFETQVALSGGKFILMRNDPTGDGDILVDEYQKFCCVNGSPVGNFTFTNHDLQRWNFLAA